jgi:hypothetical protein
MVGHAPSVLARVVISLVFSRTLTCAIVSGIPAQHQNIPDAFEARISYKIEIQSQIRP